MARNNKKRRMKKRYIGAIVALLVSVIFGSDAAKIVERFIKEVPNISITADISMPSDATKVSVVRVKDGDTFVCKIGGKEETVRLIGVDTPESVHPDKEKNTKAGDEASANTKEILQEGSDVYLEFDVSERDKYGRLLAYVYLDQEDNPMLNAYLLESGYANLMTIPPNVKYVNEFKDIVKERKAK